MSRSAGHSFLLESLSKGSGSDLRDSTGHRLRSGMGRGRANFENSWRADPKRAIQDGPLSPFKAPFDAFAADIEANEAKREAAEEKYIKDRDMALSNAEREAEAAEDAREIEKLKSKAAHEAQKMLFATLKKDPRFGPAAAVETEFEPRADSSPGSGEGLPEDGLLKPPVLTEPGYVVQMSKYVRLSSTWGYSEPATQFGHTVNSKATKATELPKQNHNKVIIPDVRVIDEERVDFSNDILEVLVGNSESRKNFVIHKAIAQERSAVLLEYAKNGARTLTMPMLEPEVFNIYVQHIYTRQLPSKPSSLNPTADDHAREITLLCKFFAVSVIMEDEVAMRDAFGGLCAKMTEQSLDLHPPLPSSEDIGIIYDKTKETCGARRLMVDWHVWKAKAAGTRVKDHAAGDPPYPNEFLADLAVALLEQRGG